MRIISGYLKSRRFSPSAKLPVRPTTDFAKESLFNILSNRLDFSVINALDLFAGTGNISFELISRGCIKVTSVDNNYKCIDFIRKTAENFEIDNIQLIKTNVFNFLKFSNQTYDLIFADPPYDLDNMNEIPDLVFNKKMLSQDGIFIIEHSKNYNFESHPNFIEHRNYGKVNFSMFKMK
jgi:16S rRNA (guanine(966)-N(2))-methyltransferase RsmD